MRIHWAFALAVLTALGTVASAADLKVGDSCPAFTMQGSDGKTYTLNDFKGTRPLVIAWFPKAFTGGCTAECKSMRDSSAQLKGLDVAYFTASVDEPQKNKAFAESLSLNFPILSDPSKEAATAFGVLGSKGFAQRWTFYVNKEGKIVEIDKKVSTKTHGEDIAKKLKNLGLAAK